MKVNVLTQHRVEQPYGVKGGKPGKKGEQYIVRKNGTKDTLKAIDGTVVYCGDKIIIKTPGGGGWGTVK
jgi:5-oxoprolinase (ATP-hydrolysing)